MRFYKFIYVCHITSILVKRSSISIVVDCEFCGDSYMQYQNNNFMQAIQLLFEGI